MALLATAKQPTSKMPVGSFIATCTGIIEDSIENSQFNPEVYRFFFDVDGKKDEEGNQMTTDAISSRAFSPKSKLWGWLEAFGLRPEVGKVMDLESVIGRKVMIVVKQHGEYTRVEELVPPPEGMASPPAEHPNPNGARREEGTQDDVPFDTDPPAESSPLNDWLTAMRNVGFSTKEIIDLCKSRFEKLPRELSDLQRDLLGKEYGI